MFVGTKPLIMEILEKYNHQVPLNLKVNFENIKYGMLVEYLNRHDGGYHSGMKVHFFNKKGVLLGNIYEFIPYDRLRLRTKTSTYYPRYFMAPCYPTKWQKIKETVFSFCFKKVLLLTTFLIKWTQKHMSFKG